jgi:hypothetical protein
MYLYRKNYAQALINADDAITNSGLVLSTSTLWLLISLPRLQYLLEVHGANTINVDPTAASIQRALYQVDQWVSAGSP